MACVHRLPNDMWSVNLNLLKLDIIHNLKEGNDYTKRKSSVQAFTGSFGH